MADEMMVKELEEVVVRFSGDSGDGMQLAGNIFSNMSATVGNDICTFPDYPADIRAPQGSLTGVSGFQVHIGAGQVYTPGDRCHVLVAMNPSALKTQIKFCKPQGLIITDSDSFEARDLEKAQFKTDNPFEELGVKQEVLEVPISSMCKESLKDSGLRDLANSQGIVIARDQARHTDVSTTNKYLQGRDLPVHPETKHFTGSL